MGLIKLFVSDIDGCLAEAFTGYDLKRMNTLRRYAAQAEAAHAQGQPSALPRFSLCSGRPSPYVEAMGQALDLRVPVLFESGGGAFDLSTGLLSWHPQFTPAIEKQVDALKSWLRTHVMPDTHMSVEIAKRTQAGIYGPDAGEVYAQLPAVHAHVAAQHPDFTVFHTDVSIDVVHHTLTKREGIAWLGQMLGYTFDEIAYIGDTNGDLPALSAVRYPFAPPNATSSVQRVTTVTRGAVIAGVLEAYRWCIRHNKRILPT